MKRDLTKWKRGRILLVEDDPGDQEITLRALNREGYQAELHVAADGPEALDFLHHEGAYANPASSPRPDLILLDLNLPGLSGKQVLAATKQDESLCRIPVVVVTTSARQQDVRESYQLGCNAYLTKPLEAHRFIGALRELYDHWFGSVTLPDSEPPGKPTA